MTRKSDTLPSEPLFGVTQDVFVPGMSMGDETDSIIAFLASGDSEPCFTSKPKAAPKLRSASKRSRRTARKAQPKAEVTAKLTDVAKPKAARKSAKPKAAKREVVGSVVVADCPKGKMVPKGQVERIRYTVHYVNNGETFRHGTKFRFFRKAEAAADALRARGLDVTIKPERVRFTRKPKAA